MKENLAEELRILRGYHASLKSLFEATDKDLKEALAENLKLRAVSDAARDWHHMLCGYCVPELGVSHVKVEEARERCRIALAALESK